MSFSDDLGPIRMRRVALIAPSNLLRATLIEVAAAGTVQLDSPEPADHPRPNTPSSAGAVTPVVSAREPDLAELERTGRADLLAGEAELRSRLTGAVRRQDVRALAGWCPQPELATLTTRLAALGAAVVELPTPSGIDPPTLLAGARPMRRAFAPLLRTYGTVPYRDIDPTIAAGIAYIVMFGMMFGDAGHGALLLAGAALLRFGRMRRLARLRQLWPFVAGAGATATCFGVLFGEFFGPTGVLPVVWLAPLDQPLPLLGTAVAVGAVLLAVSYGIGATNRWREGGLRLALYSGTGIAGATTFLGLGVVAAGAVTHIAAVIIAGTTVTALGVTLSAIGTFTESGGGATGVAQAGIGIFDLLVRLGSNVVSFARLAAFGMTHAALGWVVWTGTIAAAGTGRVGPVLAVIVFLAGNVVAFALEALVAGVQALRLEFYELFSRVFVEEGRPFEPWLIRIENSEVDPW